MHTSQSIYLKTNLSLVREDCQHAVIDEFLCMVTGCAWGTDVSHWVFKQKSAWFKFNKITLGLNTFYSDEKDWARHTT